MNIWIIGIGEPLPIDGKNVRLRRQGNFALYASNEHKVKWFSVSFNHYEKNQRVNSDKAILLNKNLELIIAKVTGYKKNVSVDRIIFHGQAAKQIVNLMEEQDEHPDIILVGNTPLELVKKISEFSIKNNIPYIIDIRDLWPDIYADAVPKLLDFPVRLYSTWSKKRIRYAFRNASGLTALADGFLDFGLKICDRKKKVTDAVVRMGYPNYRYEEYKRLFSESWSDFDLQDSDFIISFTGNFGRQFSFDKILQAAKRLYDYKDIKFVLCGVGEYLEKIKEKATENVIFSGWIEKDKLLSLLSNSSLGLAPYINSVNYNMNTPNKFGEYLSASLPILVEVDGEMRILTEKNECGKYYDSSDELADIILEYYKQPKKLEYQRKNARKLYLEMFNSDNTNKELMNNIETIIKNR